MKAPRINSNRLNATIKETCDKWGAIPDSPGMCRLALSSEDKCVREWLISECRRIGCEIKVDTMGNIFAIRPGVNKDREPIGIGSHLDTQPAGECDITLQETKFVLSLSLSLSIG
jgi:acetylornithine deacetylase/succinyl-diaminopimelate desuccinylase-like protein